MRAAKVQASLRIRAVSPEPPLLAHTSSESRGTVKQKARSLVPLNGWTFAVEICHDGMLEDTNSLDGAQLRYPLYVDTLYHVCVNIQKLIGQHVNFTISKGIFSSTPVNNFSDLFWHLRAYSHYVWIGTREHRTVIRSRWKEPPHDKTNKVACASSEDSDQSLRCALSG